MSETPDKHLAPEPGDTAPLNEHLEFKAVLLLIFMEIGRASCRERVSLNV